MRKLKLLFAVAALAMGGVCTVNAQTDGEYYLYDSTAKVFLTRGASYGTEGSADKYGIPVIWNSTDGTIRFKDWSDTGLFKTGTAIFTDGTAGKWAFEAVTGGYLLKYVEDGAYVRHSDGGWGKYLNFVTDASEATVWTFMSKAEHDALVATYVNNNYENVINSADLSTTSSDFISYLAANYAAKDMTSKVATARFAGNVGGWTWTARNRTHDGQPAYGTDFVEFFQTTGVISQTVTGLDKGVYKVTVNGFERSKDYATCNTLGVDGYEIVAAYMAANGEQVAFKSWYSEKEGTNNPDNTAQAVAAFNNDKYKNELYTYVGEDGKLDLSVVIPMFAWGHWVLFNNVTLTYYSDAVSEEDASALLEKAATYLSKPMLGTLASAIESAKTAFETSKTIANYNALKSALDNSETSIESYASAKNVLDLVTAQLENTNLYTAAALEANYTTYKTKYDNRTLTNAEANSLVFCNRRGGLWPAIALSTWAIDGTSVLSGDEVIYINNWSTEGNTDNSGMTTPFVEYWVSDVNAVAARTFTSTVEGLTAEKMYKVTALVRVRQQNSQTKADDDVTIQVGEGNVVNAANGTLTNTSYFFKTVEAVGAADADGKLVIKIVVKDGNHISWLAFKDVNYVEFSGATNAEKQALANAITAAEAKTLGFEKDEFAPYNNVAALEALAAAKDIDTNIATSAAVVEATTALTNATWTANAAEVNAICGGDFTQYETVGGQDLPYGWNLYNTGNNSRIMGGTEGTNNAGLSATTSGKALLMKFNATYGESMGYTMPLKAGKIYKITFKYGGWSNTPNTVVSLTDPSNTAITLAPNFKPETNDAYNDATHWYNYTGYFVATTTGDYKLNFNKVESGQQQIVIADIDLRTAEAIEFADGSVPAYVPGTYPSVKVTRSMEGGRWYTAVYPFVLEGIDNMAELKGYNSETGALSFKSITASVANKPFLMRSEAAKTAIELTNVDVTAAVATDASADGNAVMKGVYATTNINSTDESTFYVMSNNTIYPVSTDQSKAAIINPYRGYIQVTPASSPVRGYTVDGEETAIEDIEIVQMENGSVYNLNGQRVEKAQKGLYIVNGKKVVVK